MKPIISLFTIIILSIMTSTAQGGYNALQLADAHGRYKKIALTPGSQLMSVDGHIAVCTDGLFVSQSWETLGNLSFVYEAPPEPPVAGLVYVDGENIYAAADTECTVCRIDGRVIFSGTAGPDKRIELPGDVSGMIIIRTGDRTYKTFIRP